MDNFSYNRSFLNEITADDVNSSSSSSFSSSDSTSQSNLNRRWSIGNLNTNLSNLDSFFSPLPSHMVSSPSTLTSSPILDEHQFNFEPVSSQNLAQDAANFQLSSAALFNQHILQQQQQEQRQLFIQQQLQKQQNIKQQNEENLSNFIKFCSSSGIELNNNINRQQQEFEQQAKNTFNLNSCIQQNLIKSRTLANNTRRKSYGTQSMNTSLKPVYESCLPSTTTRLG